MPKLGNNGSPILGSSYDVTLSDALGGSLAVLVSGLSDTSYNGGALPAALPGAPGCDVLVAPEVLDLYLTSATGAASATVSLPPSPSFIGSQLYHQWAVVDNVNALGVVVSDAGRATVDQ